MATSIVQGVCRQASYVTRHDDDGIAYRLHTCVFDGVTVKIRTPDEAKFSPSNDDYLVVEYDADSGVASRAFRAFPLSGVGSGWKKLRAEVKDERPFYKYVRGVVDHKERVQHQSDGSRDGYSGGHTFRVVLTDERAFQLDDRDGDFVKAGDDVEHIASSESQLSAFRNLTSGYTTRLSPAMRALLGALTVGFLAAIGRLLVTTKEWDGGRIAFLFILAFIPVSILWGRTVETREQARLLKVMERFRA